MTTALQVFEAAMALTDNLNATGQAVHSGTTAYQYRTIPILNTLITHLYPYSIGATLTVNTRPLPTKLVTINDNLDIDDGLALAVLPFALAGHLLANENPAQSNLWLQRYAEELAMFRNHLVESEDIENIYGRFDTSDGTD